MSTRRKSAKTVEDMDVDLNLAIEEVARAKGIEPDSLRETLEQAMQQAAKKVFGMEREIEASYSVEDGGVQMFLVIRVADEITDPYTEITIEEAEEHGIEAEVDDELLFEIYYRNRKRDKDEAAIQDEKYGDILQLKNKRALFGRIAAQTARQVITQRIREAERDNVYNEYIDRKGELITGIVRRFERGNIIIDLGRAEAILPVREQVARESYRPGDRVQSYVLDVQRNVKGPQVVLSRASEGLLIKLFEMEVPEIYEGIVRIETAAREPGSRAKIAVSSRDPDVDPVGACVGMKGSRVQAVVQELRGEKIDIVPYSEDSARFVCNAIQPAEVSRVFIDDTTFTMELIVPDDQLSQAIGRRGQNVRLASRLTGWKIDIHSESKVLELEEEAREALTALDDINGEHIDTMWRLGYRSLEHIVNTPDEELANVPGISLEDAERIRLAAEGLLERRERGEDIRPSAPLPEGYDLEAEWNRWPADVDVLSRAIFDKCVRTGRFTLEDLAAEEIPENFAKALGVDNERAVNIIYAAREALAALRAAERMAAEHVAEQSTPAPSDAEQVAAESADAESADAAQVATTEHVAQGVEE